MGHSPHSLHILRIPIIKEWGKAVLRADRHISQFVDLPAVPLYFGLSLFCRTADISKCLFQYDHLLSWPDRFPLPGVFPKRNTHKAFRSVDVLWTSGFFSSLFRCLPDIRLLWFFVFRFFPSFQCNADTVASQLIIRIGHFNADCLKPRLCRRKDGSTSSGKRV